MGHGAHTRRLTWFHHVVPSIVDALFVRVLMLFPPLEPRHVRSAHEGRWAQEHHQLSVERMATAKTCGRI